MSMDLRFNCISLKGFLCTSKYCIASQNPHTFDNRPYECRHMVRCGRWLFVWETWKIWKVRNSFPRYLRQIIMDICFLYIILKCISSLSITFIVCPNLSRIGGEIKQKLYNNWCTAFFRLPWGNFNFLKPVSYRCNFLMVHRGMF